MGEILIGNAPCSWGSLEFDDARDKAIGYEQMLDELAETGYQGTELGDWGYMPTAADRLADELARRQLAMLGAFVPVRLSNESLHQEGAERAVRTSQLLAAVHAQNGDRYAPFLVLADENGSDPVRTREAGRIAAQQQLSEDQRQTFAAGAEKVARAVRDATGLRTAFHHHCGGFVETPDEIGWLLDLTDPDLLGLTFDTGHLVYGSGASDAEVVLRSLEQFAERIWYVHFKDCQPEIAHRCRTQQADYFTAVGAGVFCELGQGCVDFPAVLDWLRQRDYEGWIVVEQDVLPGMGAPRESAARNRQYLQSIGV